MEKLCSQYLDHDDANNALLREIYHVDCATSRSSIPKQMLEKLNSQGKNATAFVVQQSIRVSNQWVPAESLAFNRARSMRFGASAGSWASKAQSLTHYLDSLHCPTSSDFCEPASRTMALEKIGYLAGSSPHAVAFANMGRLTPAHGVVATTTTSNPLRLTRDDTVGLFSTAHDWLLRAHAAYGEGLAGEESHELPTLTFDLLPAAGASQLHPHLQPHLSRHRYPGKWEATRLAACAYAAAAAPVTVSDSLSDEAAMMGAQLPSSAAQSSYYWRLLELHAQLGLTVARTDSFVAFVSLTSAGNGVELAILGSGALVRASVRSSALAAELGGVFHDVVVSGARQALGWTSFSSSCAFPPMLPTASEGGGTARRRRGLLESGMPRYCKIVQRTQAAGVVVEGFGADFVMDGVSDISANELYETPVVSTDLFEAAARLRAQISLGPAPASRT